jgi:hypothetical protein
MVATTSAQLIKEIREITPNVLISFSRGKDSLASYLRIKDEFERVVPYCYEVIHGLEFIEDSLAYYENLMGQRIMRFPAPGISRMLKHRVYQPPGRSQAIDWMDMPEFTHDNLQESACKDAGLDPLKTYNALGLRAKDSAMRAMVIKKHGAAHVLSHLRLLEGRRAEYHFGRRLETPHRLSLLQRVIRWFVFEIQLSHPKVFPEGLGSHS